MPDTNKPVAQRFVTSGTFVVMPLSFPGVTIGIDPDDSHERWKADIIGVSALMTTTMMYMKEVIEELVEAGIRDDFKVMVGGAPVTVDWAEEIGADGYAKDAFAAIQVAKDLLD